MLCEISPLSAIENNQVLLRLPFFLVGPLKRKVSKNEAKWLPFVVICDLALFGGINCNTQVAWDQAVWLELCACLVPWVVTQTTKHFGTYFQRIFQKANLAKIGWKLVLSLYVNFYFENQICQQALKMIVIIQNWGAPEKKLSLKQWPSGTRRGRKFCPGKLLPGKITVPNLICLGKNTPPKKNKWPAGTFLGRWFWALKRAGSLI